MCVARNVTVNTFVRGRVRASDITDAPALRRKAPMVVMVDKVMPHSTTRSPALLQRTTRALPLAMRTLYAPWHSLEHVELRQPHERRSHSSLCTPRKHHGHQHVHIDASPLTACANMQ